MNLDTGTVDNVVQLAETMDKVGMVAVVISAFLILFMGMILFILRAMSTSNQHMMRQQQQLLNNLIDKKDKEIEEKEAENRAHYNEKEIVAIFCNLNKGLKSECRKFLESTNCDRIGIYVFHNGTTSSHGLPFFKVSCVCEYIRRGSGISNHINDSTNIPLTVFDDIIQSLYTNGVVLVQNNVENAIHSSSFYLEKDKVDTAIFTAIYDSMDNVMGFVLGEYKRVLDQVEIDSDNELYRNLCARLRPVLEFSGYQGYSS